MLKKTSSEAAGDSSAAGVSISPAQPRAGQDRFVPVVGYVEDFDETRTKLGKERVHWVKRLSWQAQGGRV
jgi:hypothetical protein